MTTFRHTASTWREISRLADAGQCACEIAEALGCDPSTVRSIAKTHGIDLRRQRDEAVDDDREPRRSGLRSNWPIHRGRS